MKYLLFSIFGCLSALFLNAQEIDITGRNLSIPSGTTATSRNNDTYFGEQISSSGSLSETFTIKNTGTSNLTLSVPTISNADFTVTANPTSPVLPGGSTSFTITFDPSTNATITGTVTITNNDADEGTYTFDIQGTGAAAGSLAWTADTGNGNGSGNATAELSGPSIQDYVRQRFP